ncbi:MAG TPA: hypothetical protein VGK29_20715 [Paludibaculum sp.]|jgi:hypothetical protein
MCGITSAAPPFTTAHTRTIASRSAVSPVKFARPVAHYRSIATGFGIGEPSAITTLPVKT